MTAGEPPIEVDDLDIAIAHWQVRSWGGAEYLVTRLAEALDCSEVYTLGEPQPQEPNPYGDVGFVDVRKDLDFPALRRLLHGVGRAAEYALWEDVDWREYGSPDILLTSGATSRAVITPEDTLHVNYCHSPPRWLYDLYHDRKDSVIGRLARPLIRRLRIRDQAVDPRVDLYFANSPVVARRLWKYYKRDADVLYPPVDLNQYRDGGDEGYYLYLGRLDREKGVPEIVRAFEDLDARLVMSGDRGDIGSDLMNRIESSPTIDYRGFVDEGEKHELLARCTAVVFNGVAEDFGIIPIEANASGKPVLSRDDGFPELLIEDGRNGVFHDGTPASIRQAVRAQRQESWDGPAIRKGVAPFAVSRFREQLRETLREAYHRFTEMKEPPGG